MFLKKILLGLSVDKPFVFKQCKKKTKFISLNSLFFASRNTRLNNQDTLKKKLAHMDGSLL